MYIMLYIIIIYNSGYTHQIYYKSVKLYYDDVHALTISLFILLTFVWSKSYDVCNNDTRSLRACTLKTRRTFDQYTQLVRLSLVHTRATDT